MPLAPSVLAPTRRITTYLGLGRHPSGTAKDQRDSSSSCIYSVGESTTMVIDIEIISVRVCLLQDCFPKQTMTRCFNLCRWHPTPRTSRLLELRSGILSYC